MEPAYMLAMSDCFGCGRLFSFNADLVPSILHEGTRKPVCQTCVDRVNPIRKANGLPEIDVLPGAYEAQAVD